VSGTGLPGARRRACLPPMRAGTSLVAAAVLGITAQSGCAAPPAGLSGRYHYEYSAGHNAAGTGMVVSYRLEIAPGTCRLTAQGYQTDQVIRCTTRATGAGLDIQFASYGDGRAVDAYGNAEYQPGQTLLTLAQRSGRVTTAWKAFTLPDEKPHPVGVYFVR
jgi:hypothetical protein